MRYSISIYVHEIYWNTFSHWNFTKTHIRKILEKVFTISPPYSLYTIRCSMSGRSLDPFNSPWSFAHFKWNILYMIHRTVVILSPIFQRNKIFTHTVILQLFDQISQNSKPGCTVAAKMFLSARWILLNLLLIISFWCFLLKKYSIMYIYIVYSYRYNI